MIAPGLDAELWLIHKAGGRKWLKDRPGVSYQVAGRFKAPLSFGQRCWNIHYSWPLAFRLYPPRTEGSECFR